MRAYIDSDVLIWHLRGDRRALECLRELKANPDYELWTGAMQRAEVSFFMRPEEEQRTMLFLSLLKNAPVDQAIVDKAGQLLRTYHPSHGIDTNDALLAATAMLTGGKVYTLNVKHYPMTELVVTKAFG